MKRCIIIFFASMLIFSTLAGCSSSQDSKTMAIYGDSIIAMEQANSYAFTMDIKQKMYLTSDEFSDVIEMQMNMEGRTIENPLSIEMALGMELGDALVPELSDLKNNKLLYYLVDDKLYMKNPLLGEVWLVEPIANLGNLGFELNPSYLVQSFNDGKELATVVEEDRYYVLTIDISEEEQIRSIFSDIIIDMVENIGANLADASEDIFQSLNINQLSLKLWVDKETNYQERIELDIKIEIDYDGHIMAVEQNIAAHYSQFGQFAAIEIPENVLSSAVSFDEFLMNSIPVTSY
ncbi:DUF6612 family protein [Desulfuribacillus alkaliarsenatis]|uniref:GerMN domain-containing protein n=1 Tax=Desulfuribacillus alkaliarsenatis TaxID=766136 RepID=A0A1E5G2N2_9FIRM|nr:DUF6612 family protein [Desulfuribacillus alkaliarsenatis]OEF97326.1 hypothetical protein BHF68_03685 [Desulfuribacillus alkaliarsenatis]